MSCAEKMKWKVEKWGDYISTHRSDRGVSRVYIFIILDMVYGHMYRQCWFTALHSEVEKHAKNWGLRTMTKSTNSSAGTLILYGNIIHMLLVYIN